MKRVSLLSGHMAIDLNDLQARSDVPRVDQSDSSRVDQNSLPLHVIGKYGDRLCLSLATKDLADPVALVIALCHAK